MGASAGLAGIDEAKREQVRREMGRFISRNPRVDPEDESLRQSWNRLLQPDRLEAAPPEALREMLVSGKCGNPGQGKMGFSAEWRVLGEVEAGRRIKQAMHYLLYEDSIPLEKRVTDLIENNSPRAFKGFAEGLVTKVLVLGHLDRFVPILYHDRRRAILKTLWNVQMPPFGTRGESVGGLITRSNDLLRELSVPPFQNLEHAANFLFDKAAPEEDVRRPRHGDTQSKGNPDRFVCASCGLSRRKTQLADRERSICTDCA